MSDMPVDLDYEAPRNTYPGELPLPMSNTTPPQRTSPDYENWQEELGDVANTVGGAACIIGAVAAYSAFILALNGGIRHDVLNTLDAGSAPTTTSMSYEDTTEESSAE